MTPRTAILTFSVGAWRRPVAHLHGVQGVEGSNPFAPTTLTNKTKALPGPPEKIERAFVLGFA